MDLQLWLTFSGAVVLLAMSPGPDNIYVLTESIAKGWKQGMSITTGLISGCIVHTTLVATGLSLFVFKYPLIFNTLKFAGAAYLVYMIFGAVKEQPMSAEQGNAGQPDPFWAMFRRGFVMNVLNPKVTLFFLVLLPQFVSSDGWSPWSQMMLLGLTFMGVSLPIFSSVALLAGKASQALSSPMFWTISKWMKVAVLAALTVLMILSEPPH